MNLRLMSQIWMLDMGSSISPSKLDQDCLHGIFALPLKEAW